MLDKMYNTLINFSYDGSEESKAKMASYLGIKDYKDKTQYSNYFKLKAVLIGHKSHPRFEDVMKILEDMYRQLIAISEEDKYEILATDDFLVGRFESPKKKDCLDIKVYSDDEVFSNIYLDGIVYKRPEEQKNILTYADNYEFAKIIDLINKKISSKSESVSKMYRQVGLALNYLLSKEVIKTTDLIVLPRATKDLGFRQGRRIISIKDNQGVISEITIHTEDNYYINKEEGFLIIRYKNFATSKIVNEKLTAWIILQV